MKLASQENRILGTTYPEKLRNLEKLGFEGIEVWGQDLAQKLEELKTALASSNIKFSTICGGPGGDLLGIDRKTRETAVEGEKEMLKICSELGGIGVITVPTFGGAKISDLYPWISDVKEAEKNVLTEECRILGKYADDVGACILLEPLNRYETHLINRLELAVEICQTIEREHVKIMADFFHMNIEEASIPESLEKAADYVLHIHLADSNRVLPGQGHTDFESAFKTLKKNGYRNFMALECGVRGDPNEELPKCVKYLKRLV